MSKTVGVIGSGVVGQTLANGFVRHGYTVMIGTNSRDKYEELRKKTDGKVAIGTFEETAKFGKLVVLAVKGSAAEKGVTLSGGSNLSGKVVLDATNPIADAPPSDGVISFFTGPNESLMERLQKLAPEAHFVKAFSCVGSAFMVNPEFGGMRPTMFICGNSIEAKAEAKALLEQFGWEVEDMGSATGARGIEPLAVLWCIPGFLRGEWSHAFKLLKK